MGRPKKPLPDRQAKAEESTVYHVSEEEVEPLKRDFSFNSEYPLAGALNAAFITHDSTDYVELHSVTRKELRDTLVELETRSAALNEALEKLPPEAIHVLYDQGFDFDRILTTKELSIDLQCASHYAEKRKQGKSFRKSNSPRINFVYKLADIWEEGTNKVAKAGSGNTYRPSSKTFFSFVNRCAEVGHIRLADWGESYSVIRDTLKLRREKRKELQEKS
jgi:hypothetical protein